jgi:hypothetical protein
MIRAMTCLALLALVLGTAACAEIRANERPQDTNPLWSPPNQGGNRA